METDPPGRTLTRPRRNPLRSRRIGPGCPFDGPASGEFAISTHARSLALVFAASLTSAAALAPDVALAAGGQAFASGRHSSGVGNWHGGGSDWRGDHWGHRGHGRPGVFWGGAGLGLGFGAIGYYGGAWGPYAYAPDGWYDRGYLYDAPTVIVDPGPMTLVEPAGQAVPRVARSPDPIFYPGKGQSAATTESDRRECNRWATTQNGAMADASIFQRATLACMEGRGYTVR